MSELKSLIGAFSAKVDELSLASCLTAKEIIMFGEIEFIIKNQNKKIFDLFRLLDDIDTASDMFRENHDSFRSFVRKTHEKRVLIVGEEETRVLYDKYFVVKEDE